MQHNAASTARSSGFVYATAQWSTGRWYAYGIPRSLGISYIETSTAGCYFQTLAEAQALADETNAARR